MTSRELLALMLRRWYLVLAGTAITLAFAATTTNPQGVYWAQSNVVLLAPTFEEFPNKLEDPPYALTPLAGVVVAEYNGTNPPLLTSSSDTTIFGMGDRSGVMVRMPNHGTQWQTVYSSPNIDVQVADSSPEQVAIQVQQVTTELKDILSRVQESIGVPPSSRVTMIASPTDPTIVHISGSRIRALGAIGLLGLILTIGSVYWLERWIVRRRMKAMKMDMQTAPEMSRR